MRGAFDEEVDRLLPYAYNVGWRFFHDRQLAEDVAQETLTRAFVRWPRVRAHASPEGWIVTTAVHVAQEMGRKRRTPVGGPVPAPVAFDDDPFAHPELLQALKGLSHRQRTVFVLRHAFDLSVETTAEMLGPTTSQVKDATHEARRKLATALGGSVEP